MCLAGLSASTSKAISSNAAETRHGFKSVLSRIQNGWDQDWSAELSHSPSKCLGWS